MAKLTKTIEYLFYLFIFLLPWQTRLIWRDASLNGFVWEYGRFSLYGTELLLWLILLLYCWWLFYHRPKVGIRIKNLVNAIKQPKVMGYWLAVVFLVIAGLSVIGSINIELGYYHWFRLLEAVALFSFLVNFNFSLHRLAVVWVGAAAVQSVFAIWQFFNQYVFANKWLGLAWQFPTQGGSIILQTDSERWLRAYGSLPHPNILAGFLVIALLLLLYLAFLARDRAQRLFVLGSLLVITPALFFSFSRSAWIALIISLIMLSFWLYHRRETMLRQTFYKIFLLLVLMVVVLGFSLSDPLVTRLVGREPLEVSSISLRMTFTEQAWNIIQQRPWQGTGIGNYTLGVYHYINSSWPGYYYQPVHNIYFLILAEIGFFGAFTFGAMIVLVFYLLWRQPPSVEKTIVFLSLWSCLIISLFDHYFWTLYFGIVVFWVVLALNFRAFKSGFDNS